MPRSSKTPSPSSTSPGSPGSVGPCSTAASAAFRAQHPCTAALAILQADPTSVPVHLRVWGSTTVEPVRMLDYPLRVDSTDYANSSAWYYYVLYPELLEMLGPALNIVAVRYTVPDDPTEHYAQARKDRPRRLNIPITAQRILVDHVPQTALKTHHALPIAAPTPELIARQLATVPLAIPPQLVTAVVVTYYGPSTGASAIRDRAVVHGVGRVGADSDGDNPSGQSCSSSSSSFVSRVES